MLREVIRTLSQGMKVFVSRSLLWFPVAGFIRFSRFCQGRIRAPQRSALIRKHVTGLPPFQLEDYANVGHNGAPELHFLVDAPTESIRAGIGGLLYFRCMHHQVGDVAIDCRRASIHGSW